MTSRIATDASAEYKRKVGEFMPSLKMRLLTSVIAVPLVILILLGPTFVITGMVMLASLIGLYEYFKATDLLKYQPLCILGFLASIVISIGANFDTGTSLALVYVFVGALFVAMLLSNREISVTHIGMLIFGLIYIPYFLSHITYLRNLEYGKVFIWLVFIGAFLTDTCAYFIGCKFGKHKLCPNISPKKSVEGAIAGVIGGGLSFVIFGIIINLFFTEAINGSFNLWLLFLLGLITAVMSEIGDLVASCIKRQFGVKDFGNLLPGHGGILDRCDSIILVAPIIFLFLYNINIIG